MPAGLSNRYHDPCGKSIPFYPSIDNAVLSYKARWALYLSRFDFTLKHIPGS